jgi:hypothetical protein
VSETTGKPPEKKHAIYGAFTTRRVYSPRSLLRSTDLSELRHGDQAMVKAVVYAGALASASAVVASVFGLLPGKIEILGPILVAAYFSGATLGLSTWLLSD